MEKINEISRLLAKRLRQKLSAGEQRALDEWLVKNRYGNVLLNELKAESDISMALRELVAIDTNTAEQKIREKVQLKVVNAEGGLSARPAHRIHFLKTAWFRYAAAIIVLFGIGAYFYTTHQKKKPQITETKPAPVKYDIMPGKDRAVLTLSNGHQVELNDAGAETIKDGTLSIENKDGALKYASTSSSSDAPHPARSGPAEEGAAYNTMTTAKGGQYRLTLADGTKVWLNAASSITYPTAFVGATREVKITGEAYFEVEKDAAKPFLVKTVKEIITVMGTAFNVNSYPENNSLKTSLVEGSVKVGNNLLKPGQAYQNGKVVQTDIEQDIAWKNGYFSLANKPLEEIMNEIARWYDIEVKYEGAVPNKQLLGKIERRLNLSDVLSGLQAVGIKIKMENNRRVVIMRQ